ncbi:hypothetical protein NVP1031O_108 [Vibrio phage 1.031.O._10N.261.46.F8]|nr:hypothetical protein NVP1031O_108 [Vibrio phage 1.031.O._10N.261.46.F8]
MNTKTLRSKPSKLVTVEWVDGLTLGDLVQYEGTAFIIKSSHWVNNREVVTLSGTSDVEVVINTEEDKSKITKIMTNDKLHLATLEMGQSLLPE